MAVPHGTLARARNAIQPARPLLLLAAGFLVLAAGAVACDAGPTEPSASGQGTLRVLLTDAPFPFDLVREANVTIQRVEAITDEGPVTLSEEERTFNLLLLRDGVTTALGDATLPSGAVRQIRLVVTDASVVLDDEAGTTYDLQVPGAAQSGIKILLPDDARVMDGGETTLTLDFDLEESFVVQGNPDTPAGIQGFLFQPVVRPLSVTTSPSDEGADEDTGDDDASDDEGEDGEGDDEEEAAGALGALRVLLTDAPFPFDLVSEANVAIARVDVVTGGGIVTIFDFEEVEEVEEDGIGEDGDGDGSGEGEEETADAGASVEGDEEGEEDEGEPEGRVFDLLELRDGLTALLGEVELPGEDLKQIRLIVSDAWIVMNDDAETTYDLKVPSGAQTGIKILLPPGLAVTPEATTILTLDFDVEHSFVVQGNPDTPAGIKGFLFKPTVHLAGTEVLPEEGAGEEEDAEGGDEDGETGGDAEGEEGDGAEDQAEEGEGEAEEGDDAEGGEEGGADEGEE